MTSLTLTLFPQALLLSKSRLLLRAGAQMFQKFEDRCEQKELRRNELGVKSHHPKLVGSA